MTTSLGVGNGRKLSHCYGLTHTKSAHFSTIADAWWTAHASKAVAHLPPGGLQRRHSPSRTGSGSILMGTGPHAFANRHMFFHQDNGRHETRDRVRQVWWFLHPPAACCDYHSRAFPGRADRKTPVEPSSSLAFNPLSGPIW